MARTPASMRTAAVLSIVLALSACGKGDKDASLAALDAQLTNNAVDPAVKDALNDPITVDPQLVGQSNRNAVRSTPRPANGALPVLPEDGAKAAAEAARRAGGKLLTAPAASAGSAIESTATLGAVARAGGSAGCAKKLVYGMEWAQRLPEAFGLYPGAQLTEAAGADRDGCTLRAASFVTAAPKQSVLDYYYTLARRAGYDGEHKLMGGDHVLGGNRASDGAAYFILLTDAPGGKTSVDVIADRGR